MIDVFLTVFNYTSTFICWETPTSSSRFGRSWLKNGDMMYCHISRYSLRTCQASFESSLEHGNSMYCAFIYRCWKWWITIGFIHNPYALGTSIMVSNLECKILSIRLCQILCLKLPSVDMRLTIVGHARKLILGITWWRHPIRTFPALLAICVGNSPVTGEFPTQRPVTRNFDVFFDLGLNEGFSIQSLRWWFETPSRPLWRHWRAIMKNANIYLCFPKLTTQGTTQWSVYG